eukprot:TRINITY_DN1941_c0_g1_i1.p1 TRINITY_DN1941_c0_g1~~TRINITY_DN1941_c0_g1_i1.p1  ORF type:complete len:487 (-),score=150.18 TRINITY_DN1941_c0_g1_i1:540-2000(-)
MRRSTRATSARAGAATAVDQQLAKLLLSPLAKGTPQALKLQFRAAATPATPAARSGRLTKRAGLRSGGKAHKGKFGTVSVVHSVGKRRYALKRQAIRSPHNPNDTSYREWRIFQRLAGLAHAGKCFNFVLMLNWFKEKRERQFMDFVLELADRSLADIDSLTFDEYRCVVFQIVWALGVAQKEMEFVHWDFHLKNILVTDEPALLCQYTDAQHHLTWYTTGPIVKITDFGLSRIRMEDGEVVYNKRQPFSELFKVDEDIESLLTDLSKLQIAWTDDEEQAAGQAQVRGLRAALRKTASGRAPLSAVLQQHLFDSLRERPTNDRFDDAHTVAVSTAGLATPVALPTKGHENVKKDSSESSDEEKDGAESSDEEKDSSESSDEEEDSSESSDEEESSSDEEQEEPESDSTDEGSAQSPSEDEEQQQQQKKKKKAAKGRGGDSPTEELTQQLQSLALRRSPAVSATQATTTPIRVAKHASLATRRRRPV